MTASIEKSSTQGFRKQKNKIVIRHSLKADMNPSIPDEGEIVFATDTKDLLIGDGITKIESLSPINGGGSNLPDPTGHSGEFLSTNGTTLSWEEVPQSDWNQTDTSAPDYIKNKPYIPEGVIVDQTYDATSTNAQAGLAVAEAVSSKLDKSNVPSTIYSINNLGQQEQLYYSASTAGNTIVQRDNTGQLFVPQTPTVDGHATSKKYVDTGLDAKQEILVSGTNIKTINNNSLLGSGNITIDSLPSQTDQSGKFLTTDGTNASWATVSSGVTDYTLLSNKPEINGNTLTGNKTASQLGFADIATSGSYTDLIDVPTFATVATSGDYDDLTNKPVIPAAQQQVDWDAVSGITSIANKPSLSTVATSGDYNDLSNQPTINDLTTTTQQNAINSGATSALISQITSNQSDISTINGKIPSTASTSNQLADIAFVNSSISNMAANYVTSDAQGDNFATKAALLAGPYYYKGQSYTLTNNDYALVEADETKNNATTRYIYDGAQWAFQYIVNNAPFTQAQLDAINSNITSTLVTNYSTHVADTTIHVTSSDKTTWNAKQEALVSGTNIKTINGNSLLGSGDITVGGSSLPSQTGHSGDFLTTDGTDASWETLSDVALSGDYTDLTNTPTIPVVVQDFWVDSTTGAITCTFSGTPTTKSVHTIIGNATINGTWSNNVFTPTTASDILENVNGFVVSVA